MLAHAVTHHPTLKVSAEDGKISYVSLATDVHKKMIHHATPKVSIRGSMASLVSLATTDEQNTNQSTLVTLPL